MKQRLSIFQKHLGAFLCLFCLLCLDNCRRAHPWLTEGVWHSEKALLPILNRKADKYRLERPLVRALIWQESRFRENVVGKAGEIGLMQITQACVSDWCRINHKPRPHRNTLFLPELNLEIGCWHLAQAAKHWAGHPSQEVLMLAQYNAGRTAVLRNHPKAREKDSEPISPEDLAFPTTRAYVRNILARKMFYLEHERK